MIKLDPIYYKDKFRSSSLVKLIWEVIIEETLYYHLGILKKFTLNITLDIFGYTVIVFDAVSSINKKVTEERTSLNHIFFNNESSSITIDITFNNHNEYSVILNQTSFFYTEGDVFDFGIIDSVIEVNCSINSIKDLKLTLLPSLSREIQYSILRNNNGISLESKNRILNFAEFEYFILYTELASVNFLLYVNNTIKEESIKKDIISIYQQIEGNKWILIIY